MHYMTFMGHKIDMFEFAKLFAQKSDDCANISIDYHEDYCDIHLNYEIIGIEYRMVVALMKEWGKIGKQVKRR